MCIFARVKNLENVGKQGMKNLENVINEYL
jgi:hypothetical protein